MSRSWLCGPLLATFLAPAAFGQQLDPATQLSVCRDMRAVYISDSETLQTMLRQMAVEVADLKKRLAEAEAKAPKPD